MRIIKLGIISVIVFAIMITVFSLLIPSRVRISRAIDLAANRQQVIAIIKDARNWKTWYPGADSLPMENLEITYTDSSVTASGSNSKAISVWNVTESSNIPGNVTVHWFMEFRLRWYPWEKFSGLLLEKRYGPVMENGLTKLKRQIEK